MSPGLGRASTARLISPLRGRTALRAGAGSRARSALRSRPGCAAFDSDLIVAPRARSGAQAGEEAEH